MPAHKVRYEIPKGELRQSDIEIDVDRAGSVLGHLRIRKGGIFWIPRGKKGGYRAKSGKGYWMNWSEVDELLKEKGKYKKMESL